MTPEFLSRLDTVFDGLPHADEIRLIDWRFEPAKLHSRSPQCWAVIGQPSGAIAEGGNGELLMRLGRDEAVTLAGKLTDKKAKLAA